MRRLSPRVMVGSVIVLLSQAKAAFADEATPTPSEPRAAVPSAEAPAPAAPASDSAVSTPTAVDPSKPSDPAAEPTPAQAPVLTTTPVLTSPPPIAPEPAPIMAVPAPIAGPANAAPNAPQDKPQEAKPEEHQGVLGPFRVGILAGTGAPSLVSGQIYGTYERVVGLSFDVGVLPTISLPVGDGAHIGRTAIGGGARVYPFRGDFFLGLGLGVDHFTGDAKVSTSAAAGGNASVQQGVNAGLISAQQTASAEASTFYIAPQIGFVHRFSFGLALGMDVACELPISGSQSSSSSAGPLPSSFNDAMSTFRTTPIPVLNLLRVGYVL